MSRIPSTIIEDCIQDCRAIGLVNSWQDSANIANVARMCLLTTKPIWRTDISSGNRALKSDMGIPVDAPGHIVTEQMMAIANRLGRVYVFEYIDKADRHQGGRLCYPQDVPAGFNPAKGIVKAA